MITFITALYQEAKEIIHTLKLKKTVSETIYQLYEGEAARLIITDSGMISAATATARHFANYPANSTEDLVVNLGIAGFTSVHTTTVAVGDLFLVSKLTEAATGRTFYPDLLYRHSFSLLPLLTTPVACTAPPSLTEDSLIDMEASALYQALLPHFSPDRMFFFKVISDVPGRPSETPINPEQLLAPHIADILSFTFSLQQFLHKNAYREPILTQEEAALSNDLKELLPMTEAMQRDYHRLLMYAKLAQKPLAEILSSFLQTLKDTPLRGKKQSMPHFSRLRYSIVNHEKTLEAPVGKLAGQPKSGSLCLPPFTMVYMEKNLLSSDIPPAVSSKKPILINHYKDLFNRSHQDFTAQKRSPALILAKKTGTLIYKGAPVCQSFGNEHFYYTSCMMNCIYHCDYCYLQGMYPSGHVVVFVNLEDYFAELEALLIKHPVYLCVSYDTDLLALEHTFSFVSRWLEFASVHPKLTLEIRTKSGNPAAFQPLAQIFHAKEHLKKQIIFAWTVSPETLCQSTEHGAASLSLRLKALQAAEAAGFSVRLCFDPMIFHGGWKENYSTLVERIFSLVSADTLYDVSIGVFRISNDYLKNMRKKRPDSAIVQYPYTTENGVSHYGSLSEEMVQYMQGLLLNYLPAEKIFVWNGGE